VKFTARRQNVERLHGCESRRVRNPSGLDW